MNLSFRLNNGLILILNTNNQPHGTQKTKTIKVKDMVKQDYYALINYRGKEKYYLVSSHEGNNIRVEYIDYNPYREWWGVWIKNGLEKIIKTFDNTTEEYKYFKGVYNRFLEIRSEEAKKRNCSEGSFGTSYILKFYRQAIKEIPNPLNLEIYQKRK